MVEGDGGIAADRVLLVPGLSPVEAGGRDMIPFTVISIGVVLVIIVEAFAPKPEVET